MLTTMKLFTTSVVMRNESLMVASRTHREARTHDHKVKGLALYRLS